jgi:hypothetical protein
MNRWAGPLVFALLTACGPSVPDPQSGDPRLADVGGGEPGGGGGDGVGGDVARVLETERERLADLDAALASGDGDAAALQRDRIARASFVAHLERCAADAEACPPRLDEPTPPESWDPSTGELGGAFTADVAAWPDAAGELAANACACRTASCADWVLAELVRWEDALSNADEDAAAESVTAARECAWARLGR